MVNSPFSTDYILAICIDFNQMARNMPYDLGLHCMQMLSLVDWVNA